MSWYKSFFKWSSSAKQVHSIIQIHSSGLLQRVAQNEDSTSGLKSEIWLLRWFVSIESYFKKYPSSSYKIFLNIGPVDSQSKPVDWQIFNSYWHFWSSFNRNILQIASIDLKWWHFMQDCSEVCSMLSTPPEILKCNFAQSQ